MNGCNDHKTEDPVPLSAEAYFEQMKQILQYTITPVDSIPETPGSVNGTDQLAADQVQDAVNFYEGKLAEAQAIQPPQALQTQHQLYIESVKANIRAFEEVKRSIPAGTPARDRQKYLYDTPDPGYAFGLETDAVCTIRDAAVNNGIDFPIDRVACFATPINSSTVGSATNPVNTIEIVHDDIYNGKFPNYYYSVSSIVSSSKDSISLTFINKNPLPFLFNLAVYKGQTRENLKDSDQIANTVADGPKVHVLKLKLEPGTYTYADNVHPYSIRGTLTVMP